MPKDPLDLTDPRAIKAIAHPARWRVIEELYSGRTLTATEAGELCGLSGSAMSYHLRTLARYGLVVQGESTDGRERRWKAAADGMNIKPLERTPANAVVAQSMTANIVDSIQRMAETSTDPANAFGVRMIHGRLRMTDEQANALDERVEALFREFEEQEEPAGPDAPPLRELFWIRGNDPRG